MDNKILELENIDFSYGNNKVLSDVNFAINRGDYVGIIGPNGSAKSTTMKLMLGLLRADKGNIKIFKTPIEKFKDFNKIGYISQDVRNFNKMFPATVGEIVALNVRDRRKKDNVDKALDLVKMSEFKNKKIGDLSGGQKQRVFIARAIVNEPDILFMDEPLVGVDIKSQNDFYNLLGNLNKELNMTLVMISHNIELISKKADKLICLNDGSVYFHNNMDCHCMDKIKNIYGESMDLLLKNH